MSKVYKIEIELDNAGFQPSPSGEEAEVARILRELADNCEIGGLLQCRLRDHNGNTVGESKVIKRH